MNKPDKHRSASCLRRRTLLQPMLLACCFAATLIVWGAVADAGPAECCERLGRMLGIGWGDGYQGCVASGCRPLADLPPTSRLQKRGIHRGATTACGAECRLVYPPGTACTKICEGCDGGCDRCSFDVSPEEPTATQPSEVFSSRSGRAEELEIPSDWSDASGNSPVTSRAASPSTLVMPEESAINTKEDPVSVDPPPSPLDGAPPVSTSVSPSARRLPPVPSTGDPSVLAPPAQADTGSDLPEAITGGAADLTPEIQVAPEDNPIIDPLEFPIRVDEPAELPKRVAPETNRGDSASDVRRNPFMGGPSDSSSVGRPRRNPHVSISPPTAGRSDDAAWIPIRQPG